MKAFTLSLRGAKRRSNLKKAHTLRHEIASLKLAMTTSLLAALVAFFFFFFVFFFTFKLLDLFDSLDYLAGIDRLLGFILFS